MKRALRFFLRGLIAVVVLSAALFGYFVYSPAPEAPRLSDSLTGQAGTDRADGTDFCDAETELNCEL